MKKNRAGLYGEEEGVKILIEMWFRSGTVCCSLLAYCELSLDLIGNKFLIGVLLRTNRRSGCLGDRWDCPKGSCYRAEEAVRANTAFWSVQSAHPLQHN